MKNDWKLPGRIRGINSWRLLVPTSEYYIEQILCVLIERVYIIMMIEQPPGIIHSRST